ncbi:hypothetical protein JD292_07045 [Leucobacter sp. CSA2]|uniref:histidine kinase n=1 Tax=Leucobacter edaphi TaxID=2796472 RepID=A0A934QEH9_9MICO|nr:histidine kinase [Leucobacter edaphi]MBK0421827.1 hypothetical protein [Leucobacter edaphi]
MTQPAPAQTRRGRLVVVATVGGLSALTGALYLWALTAIPSSEPIATPAQLGFLVANIAAAGLLWWHREFPVRVYLAVLAVYILSALASGYAGNGGLTLALWFCVFALTAYAPIPRAAAWIGVGWALCAALKVALAVRAGISITAPEVALAMIADVGFFFIACAALGLGFRFQAKRARDAEEHSRIVEAHARAVHAEAVANERNRLARDLHDLAAHELMDALLAVRVLRVDGADPVLAEIEEKTARALANMRTVVRTLRGAEDGAGTPTGDGLPLGDAAAAALAELADSRGARITSVIAVAEPVSDAAASTVLSVLRECVLNADRHAAGVPVTVDLRSAAGEVALTVRNALVPHPGPSTEGTGYGLIGAAERARLVGGSFHAGPVSGGHWSAELRLPGATTEPRTETRS